MNQLDRLTELKIKDKEKFQKIFSKTIKEIQDKRFIVNFGEKQFNDYYLITEENRLNSYFIHIVPKEAYDLFKDLQIKIPNDFLGFSVLAGKLNNKDIRVSCFGVECSKLGKSLFKGN